MKTYSIILPATDETFSLEQTIEQVDAIIPKSQYLVVTHPKITTPECRVTIEKLKAKCPTLESFDQTRKGIGGAIQDAIDRCTGDLTVLMAADLETDPAALPLMIEKMEQGADIAATTRWRGGARFKGYDPVKLVLNFFFQHLYRTLYWTDLTDLTYAYRMYKTEILKKIDWHEDGFTFLFESVLKPLRLGYRIEEVPAPWRARQEGISHNSFNQTFKYAYLGLRLRFQSTKRMWYSRSQ